MFALKDFYEGIGKEMARRQMVDEAREFERPPRPSRLAWLLNKLTNRPSLSESLTSNQQEELSLDMAQCE